MQNIPVVKLGIVAVSRDCFPIGLSIARRDAIMKAYKGELYECPVTVENELDMLAENELTGAYAVCEVKRQREKIDLGIVVEKFAAFQRATGKWQKAEPKFLALSLSDM